MRKLIRGNNIYYLILITFYFCLLLLHQIQYRVIDDTFMMQLVSGNLTGDNEPFIVFQNIILGKILVFMYKVFGFSINWYFYFYFFINLVSSLLLVKTLLRIHLNAATRRLFFVILLFGVILYQLCWFQFTTNAAILAVASYFYFFTKDKKNKYDYTISIGFFLLASFIRFEAVFLILIFAISFTFFKSLYENKLDLKTLNLKALNFKYYIILMSVIFAFKAIDYSYVIKYHREFSEYNIIRASIFDNSYVKFGRDNAKYFKSIFEENTANKKAENNKLYNSIGLTDKEFEFFKSGHVDLNNPNYYNENIKKIKDNFEFDAFFSLGTVIYRFMNKNVMVLIFILMIMIVLFSTSVKQITYLYLPQLLLIIVLSYILSYIGLMAKFRVLYSMYMFVICSLLFNFNGKLTNIRIVVTVLITSLSLYFIKEPFNYRDKREQNDKLINVIDDNYPDKMMISLISPITNDYLYQFPSMEKIDKSEKPFALLNAWFTKLKSYKKVYNFYDSKSLVDVQNRYFVVTKEVNPNNKSSELISSYLLEQYNKQLVEVGAHKLCGNDILHVYKVE